MVSLAFLLPDCLKKLSESLFPFFLGNELLLSHKLVVKLSRVVWHNDLLSRLLNVEDLYIKETQIGNRKPCRNVILLYSSVGLRGTRGRLRAKFRPDEI